MHVPRSRLHFWFDARISLGSRAAVTFAQLSLPRSDHRHTVLFSGGLSQPSPPTTPRHAVLGNMASKSMTME